MSRLVFAWVLLGALLPGPAGATSAKKLSLGELSRGSERIVLADVEDASSRWDGKEIYTYVTLRVTEGVKGAKRHETITVRQIGGQVGTIASIVAGTPSFRKGESVVVFLSAKDRTGHPWVMGLQQGKYTVESDGKGGRRVRNELSGISLLSGAGLEADAKGATEENLAVFLEAVRRELGEEPVVVDPTVER
jgi:hypothetical protein